MMFYAALEEAAKKRGLGLITRNRFIPGTVVSADMDIRERVLVRWVPVKLWGFRLWDRTEALATEDEFYQGEWVVRSQGAAELVTEVLHEAEAAAECESVYEIIDQRTYYW